MEIKSICNDNNEELLSSPPNQKLENTKTIRLIIVNEINKQVIGIMSHYLLKQIFFAFPITNLIYMRRMELWKYHNRTPETYM